MALIKCPECGKKISDQAPACIHCGCPITPTHEQDKLPKTTTDLENLMQNELPKDTQGINECVEGDTITVKNKLKLWHKILIIGATIILLVFAAIALFGGLFNNNEPDDSSKDPPTNVSTSTNDQEGSDNTDTTDSSHPNNDPIESFISNGHFTFSARSFIKLFDDADKEAKGYNYTYMRMNGETSLFYELAEISGGYEKVRSAGMISFVKEVDTTLSIEDDYTENIITKINVLVEDVDDVPPILVGCMCAVDPALDFTIAYNLGMDVVETAGTEEGYVHNGIKYVVIADGEYYYIIISIAGFTNNKEDATNNPSGNSSSTESPSYEKPTHTTATLTATTTDLNLDGTSELVYFYVNPSNIDAIVDYTIADESVVEIQRGGWSGNTAQLLFIPVSTGETTVTVYIDGYDGCSVKISVSAYVDDGVSSGFDFDDPFITSTESEFRLENGNGITYITAHNITGEYSLSCDVDGSDIVECIWGDWDGDTVSLTFIPLGSGNAFVTVYIEGYYDNSAITIPVFVP